MSKHVNTTPSAGSPDNSKLPRQVYQALVALGLKMPTTEEEVRLAELDKALDQTPMPDRFRVKLSSPGQAPISAETPKKNRGPDQKPEQRPGF